MSQLYYFKNSFYFQLLHRPCTWRMVQRSLSCRHPEKTCLPLRTQLGQFRRPESTATAYDMLESAEGRHLPLNTLSEDEEMMRETGMEKSL